MKKTILIILAILTLSMCVMPALAAEGNTVQPLYNNISSIIVGLDIDKSAGSAYAGGAVSAYYQVPVEVLVQLQIYKNGIWQTLRSWSNSGTGDAYAGGYYTVESGYNYRTKVTGSICNDLGIPIESESEVKEVYYPAT